MSKGHQIQRTQEVPLVVEDKLQELTKTSQACAFLKRQKAFADVVKVHNTKKQRAGRGKIRNRRRIKRRGPLIIYDKNQGISKAFRNIPGVDTICVDKLNLLLLAPGGHVGRFCIWTESAFKKLDQVYGNYSTKSTEKNNFNLPMPIMHNANLMQILKHQNIQKVLQRPKLGRVHKMTKRNPLRNVKVLLDLNPYASVEKKVARKLQQKRLKEKAAFIASKTQAPEEDKRTPTQIRDARRKALRAAFKSTPEYAHNKEVAKQHRRDKLVKTTRLANLRRAKHRSDKKADYKLRKTKKYLGKQRKPKKEKKPKAAASGAAKDASKKKKVPAGKPAKK